MKKAGLDDYIIAKGAKRLRQLIDETKEGDLSAHLCDLCARFIYVRDGSYVLEMATGRRYTVSQFVGELTANLIVEVPTAKGARSMTAGRAFMQSAMRPEVDKEVYEPGAPRLIRDCFNRWTGWGVEPVPGDVSPFLQLIEVIAPISLQREWFLDWCAYPVQNPGAKLSQAVVLLSRQGVGKNTIGDSLRAVYGPNNSIEITQDTFDSDFNAPLACKQLIVGDEVTTAGRDARRRADIVKSRITASTMIVNKKYEPQVEFPNTANFLLLTNHQDAFHLDEYDRRFAVIESPAPPQSIEFYRKVRAWLGAGGAAHLFYFLLRRDLSNFNPHAHAPHTEARANMISASRTVLTSWVHDLRDDPNAVTINARSPYRHVLSLHTADELLEMFDGKQGRCSVKAMTLALRAADFGLAYKKGDGQVKTAPDIKRRLWAIRDARDIHALNHDQIAARYWRERGLGSTAKHRRRESSGSEGGHSA